MSRDLVFGGGCLALAVGYYALATAIPESALADAVGPQGLPKTYALVLGALSLILIARSARRPEPTTQSPIPDPRSPIPDPRSPIPDPRSPIPDPRSPIPRIAGMLLIGAIYLAIVPWLGYMLSLMGLIAATTYYQGGGLNKRTLAVAFSGALFFWALFVAMLGIPHPPGIWPSLF